MTMKNNTRDREYNKFEETSGGDTAVRVKIKDMPDVTGEFTVSGLTISGKITEVELNDTTWTAIPLSALSDRNGVAFQNPNGVEVKINFDPNISTYTGWAVQPSGEFFIDVSENIIVYAKSASGTPTIVVMEVA